MKRKFYFYRTLLVLIGMSAFIQGCNKAKPSIDLTAVPVQTERETRLIPREALLSEGLSVFMPDDPFKSFWIENWKTTQQTAQWNVESPAGTYVVETLVKLNGVQNDETVTLELSDGKHSTQCSLSGDEWQRCTFDAPLELLEGTSTLTARIVTPGKSQDFSMNLFSFELTEKELHKQLAEKAKALRSNAQWMGKLKYGFFFHWNANSMPRKGEPKSYQEAVRDFDAEAFAKMVNECGGELVFFTTAWAQAYFPAPLESFDRILPGRTTERNLVADLADALGKYGIKLILYYNFKGDDAWQKALGYTKETPQNLIDNTEKILEEIGERYGDKIAGLWLDDGIAYYPCEANFEKLTRAIKKGNKDLVVGYNSWILPRLTDFQDFFGGELGLSESSAGVGNPWLPAGGNGVFTGGPQEGLQATYCGLMEPGDWTHIEKDSEIGDPLLSAEQLVSIIQASNERGNLPMMNLQIYQDGTISPKTRELLKTVKEQLEKK